MPETAPTLETPPGPPTPPPPPPPRPESPAVRVRTARFGELDHTEVGRLLDSLDDERERARFRESVYISLFFWLAVAWFFIYGPRVLFHQGKIVSPVASEKHNTKEMATLDVPRSLLRTPHVARTPVPPAPAPSPAPTPLPPVSRQPTPLPQPAQQPQRPAPQPAQQQAQQPTQQQAPPQQARTPPPQNLPQTPQPRPTPQSIPDAPRPSFQTPGSAGQSIADAARVPSRPGFGESGELGSAPRVGRGGYAPVPGAQLLSDPQGVDFDPYITRILAMIKANWLPLIPEECNPPISKAGTTLIRFKIEKDGTITAHAMVLEDSTGDNAINKAAWGSINAVGKFPPLPKQYPGSNIELRIRFEIIQHQQR